MLKTLKLAALAMLIGAGAFSSAQAAQKVIVGDTGAPTSIIGRTLSLFKERAETYSKGDLNVEIYSNSQLGTFGTMATQMKVNLVNVMFIQPDALGQQVSIVTANSWPFLFANAEEMLKAWNGAGGQALIAEVEKRSGYRMIAPSWNVPRWIYTSREAKSLADVKGMKIRVPVSPMGISLFKSLQASPTSLQFSEVYSALQTRVVDAQENPLAIVQTAKLYEVQK